MCDSHAGEHSKLGADTHEHILIKRTDPHIGRVVLHYLSNEYLLARQRDFAEVSHDLSVDSPVDAGATWETGASKEGDGCANTTRRNAARVRCASHTRQMAHVAGPTKRLMAFGVLNESIKNIWANGGSAM